MNASTVVLPGLLVGLGLTLTLSQVARADVPPSPGYVESCTAEKQQGPGEECISCGDAYHGDRDACQKHAGGGYERRCRTSGASVWTEVWCKRAAGGSAPVVADGTGAGKDAPVVADGTGAGKDAPKTVEDKPAAPAAGRSGGGCSIAGSGGIDGSGWLLVIIGLGLVGSRRR